MISFGNSNLKPGEDTRKVIINGQKFTSRFYENETRQKHYPLEERMVYFAPRIRLGPPPPNELIGDYVSRDDHLPSTFVPRYDLRDPLGIIQRKLDKEAPFDTKKCGNLDLSYQNLGQGFQEYNLKQFLEQCSKSKDMKVLCLRSNLLQKHLSGLTFKYVETLVLDDNKINNLEYLPSAPNLISLSLCGNPLVSPHGLGKYKHLENIFIARTPLTLYKGIARIFRASCPKLRTIDNIPIDVLIKSEENMLEERKLELESRKMQKDLRVEKAKILKSENYQKSGMQSKNDPNNTNGYGDSKEKQSGNNKGYMLFNDITESDGDYSINKSTLNTNNDESSLSRIPGSTRESFYNDSYVYGPVPEGDEYENVNAYSKIIQKSFSDDHKKARADIDNEYSGDGSGERPSSSPSSSTEKNSRGYSSYEPQSSSVASSRSSTSSYSSNSSKSYGSYSSYSYSYSQESST